MKRGGTLQISMALSMALVKVFLLNLKNTWEIDQRVNEENKKVIKMM